MYRLIALGLAMLAGAAIKLQPSKDCMLRIRLRERDAVLDLRAINSPDVFKTLPSKTGDFDGHTA